MLRRKDSDRIAQRHDLATAFARDDIEDGYQSPISHAMFFIAHQL